MCIKINVFKVPLAMIGKWQDIQTQRLWGKLKRWKEGLTERPTHSEIVRSPFLSQLWSSQSPFGEKRFLPKKNHDFQNNVVLPTFVEAPGLLPRSWRVTQPPPWLLSPRAGKKVRIFFKMFSVTFMVWIAICLRPPDLLTKEKSLLLLRVTSNGTSAQSV